MAFERAWQSIGPVAFTATGGADGTVTISSVEGFKVKQSIVISATSLPDLKLEVKRVISSTKLIVGPVVTTGKMTARQDISAYSMANLATIRAEEQKKAVLPATDIIQAVYEQEPTVAIRTLGVDYTGRPYTNDNPLPVNASVSIGDVSIGTDGYDLTDPDSMNITGSEDGTKTGIKHSARIDAELDLRVGISDGLNKATVSADGKLSTDDSNTQLLISNVLAQLQAGSLVIGTEDGTETGTQHVFVNNLKSMILASQDRVRDVSYLDASIKKDRRVDKFEFTSATFPGLTLIRQFNYTFINNEYVYTNDNWSIV